MNALARILGLWTAIGLVCVTASSHAQNSDSHQDPDGVRIELNKGLLTLDARDAPLHEVMRAIGRAADFKMVLVGNFTDTPLVSVSFENLPLHKAVDRLVGAENRIIVYAPFADDSGQKAIAQVWLLQVGTMQTDMSLNAEQSIASGSERDVNGYKLARLTTMLQPEQAEIMRNRAAMALGKFKDERAVLALESALLDHSPSVRKAVINALGLIGNERASEALAMRLLNEDIDESEKLLAIRALSLHDTEIARNFLRAGGNLADTNN